MPRPHDSPQGDRRLSLGQSTPDHSMRYERGGTKHLRSLNTLKPQRLDAFQMPLVRHERGGTRHLRSLNALKHQALDTPQDATQCALRAGIVGALNIRGLRGAWCARKPCANRYAVAHAYAPMIVETLHPVEIPHVSCVLSFHRTRSFHDKSLRRPNCRAPRRRRRLRNAPGGHRARTVMSRGTTGPIDMCRGATGLKRSWYSGATRPRSQEAGGRAQRPGPEPEAGGRAQGPGRGGGRAGAGAGPGARGRRARGTAPGRRATRQRGHRGAGPPG
jgi:hypothetical protein